MVVEFIGAPGAGKSTLLPVVSDLFQRHCIQGYSVVEAARPFVRRTLPGQMLARAAPLSLQGPLLWQLFFQMSKAHRLRFFAAHPALIRQVASSQRHRPIPPVERRHCLHWFYHLTGCYQFLTTHAEEREALLFDEGFVHRVVQFNASELEEPDPDRIRAYVDLVPRADVVIFVDAPWELCVERVYRRGLWERFKHKSRSDVSTYIANSHRIVTCTVDYLRQTGWNVIDVDNGHEGAAPLYPDLQHQIERLPLERRPVSQA